jgi:UDP-2,3-diacylglucosamine pyrophosphatase LpxH
VTGYPPRFDELYVVSDIHMGGDKGFQIFSRGRRLGTFIRHVGAQRPAETVGLVLNGDIIDSLADVDLRDYVTLDGETAIRMIERIAKDDAFSPVWDALADFVKLPRRHLAIVVGNHDIELALPIVEDWVRRRLAGDDLDARSRIVFSTHGGGIACQVGAARVFCTHGNEVDEWNWVDYNLLGQLANAINAGRAADPAKWKPNAGTRLVKDVMNIVKRRYPFVDLLKPEVAAVAGVLVAIDKDTFKKIDLTDAFPVLRDKIRGGLITKNLLGAEATSFSGVAPHDLADELALHLLGASLREAVRDARGGEGSDHEDELLLRAGQLVAQGRRPTDMIAAGDAIEILSTWDLVAGWVGLVGKVEGLRRALFDWVKDDSTYDASKGAGDATYEAISARVADTVDIAITGHTHLARALPLMGKEGFYFNCGTWIRLLRLTPESLAKDVFEKTVWPRLTTQSVSDLDAVMIPGAGGQDVPLLFDRSTAVRVSRQADRVVGELLRVSGGENGAPLALLREDGTASCEVRR